MQNNDFEIFDGKSFKHLCSDIYERSEKKKQSLDFLISDLRPLVQKIDDALQIVPLIQGYLEISVKNDEQLIKLAQVSQRLQTSQMEKGGGALLTDEERENLWNEIKSVEETVSLPISASVLLNDK